MSLPYGLPGAYHHYTPEDSAQYFIVANYLSSHLERFLPFKRTIYQFP